MFYIEKDNKIVLFDENKQKLQNTLLFMPQYKGLEILETAEDETIVDYKIVTVEQQKADELKEAKEAKLAEALALAYEYENKTGFITFDGRPVGMEGVKVIDTLTPTLSLKGEGDEVDGERNTMKLSVELFNQSKFFQMVIGFAQGLITDDFIYSTKEDVVVYINEQEAQGIYYAITEALSKLWTVLYPSYKSSVNNCQTIAEVEAIEIDYTKVEVETE